MVDNYKLKNITDFNKSVFSTGNYNDFNYNDFIITYCDRYKDFGALDVFFDFKNDITNEYLFSDWRYNIKNITPFMVIRRIKYLLTHGEEKFLEHYRGF